LLYTLHQPEAPRHLAAFGVGASRQEPDAPQAAIRIVGRGACTICASFKRTYFPWHNDKDSRFSS